MNKKNKIIISILLVFLPAVAIFIPEGTFCINSIFKILKNIISLISVSSVIYLVVFSIKYLIKLIKDNTIWYIILLKVVLLLFLFIIGFMIYSYVMFGFLLQCEFFTIF